MSNPPVWKTHLAADAAFDPQYHQNPRVEIVSFVNEPPGVVLDVGCGGGATGRLIKEKFPGTRVIGVYGATVMPKGGCIVVTASLAGLTEIADDPIYGLTKHAVVGFVRSVAPQLATRGIRIQAVCPAWADTPLTTQEFRQELEGRGFRLLQPHEVAAGVWAAYRSEGTGEAWIVQPGREPLHYEFRGVPGPR